MLDVLAVLSPRTAYVGGSDVQTVLMFKWMIMMTDGNAPSCMNVALYLNLKMSAGGGIFFA